jgi:predicted transcriptional regulator
VRKSKLESYEEILEALVSNPLTHKEIACNTNLDDALPKRHLGFLMKNELIEERKLENIAVYAITERGIAVLRALSFQKYLGKIKNTIRAIDEALEVIATISKQEYKPKGKNEG